ncbi:MFS transporter [Colwellia sp. E2M01]|uniref:MFS transporter n=1 Tax=Colwellia sp. E2M01 TaxID=2841561 RepID=UPI001C088794|nr:MFS transporter [Colwellia sp. E2M01]MBU2869140.1 MFS transporter [Colwellia sp. E2M01]
MSQSSFKHNFLSFKGRAKILHSTWLAFFVTFLVWFSHAPLMSTIQESMGLTDIEVKVLLILNVALTIPARIITGMLVDKYGPRNSYTAMLVATAALCFFFAFAQTFEALALAKFLMGFVGAGFVIGIRMISEWYPANQLGLAEGLYKGMGNVGSAVGAGSLVYIASLFGGEDGWRYAIASTGVIALLYSAFYYYAVTDTPAGSTYFKPNKSGGLELTSKRDFIFCLVFNIPMVAALAILTWRVTDSGVVAGTANEMIIGAGLLSDFTAYFIYGLLLALLAYQSWKLFQVNKDMLQSPPVDEILQYKFKQVAILSIGYGVTFGSELAVISMLAQYFENTFLVAAAAAGMFGACFAAVDVLSCPSGGMISDKLGRKKPLIILLSGAAVGFLVMSMITPEWPLAAVVATMMICSFFLGSAAGCVFAVVPLVKRKLTGQIAGTVGAYGNVGAVVFLLVFSFVTPSVFFATIGAGIAFAVLCTLFLDEPKDKMAEVMPDGTVQMIDVH